MRNRQVDVTSRLFGIVVGLARCPSVSLVQHVVANDGVDLDASKEASLCLEHAEDVNCERDRNRRVNAVLDAGEDCDTPALDLMAVRENDPVAG